MSWLRNFPDEKFVEFFLASVLNVTRQCQVNEISPFGVVPELIELCG